MTSQDQKLIGRRLLAWCACRGSWVLSSYVSLGSWALSSYRLAVGLGLARWLDEPDTSRAVTFIHATPLGVKGTCTL